MEVEDVMLSEISQERKHGNHVFSLMRNYGKERTPSESTTVISRDAEECSPGEDREEEECVDVPNAHYTCM